MRKQFLPMSRSSYRLFLSFGPSLTKSRQSYYKLYKPRQIFPKINQTKAKMHKLLPISLVVLNLFALCQGGVLIWGSESIQLPSLKQFNNEDFDLLKSYMRRPKVVVFQGDPMEISNELQDLLRNKYTAYVPSSNLNIDNVIDLKGDSKSNFKLIQDTLDNCSRENDNILALILTNHEAAPSVQPQTPSNSGTLANRPKREASEEFTTDIPETVTIIENYQPVTGAVVYQAPTKNSEVVIVYSSSTPVLKINSTNYILGKAAMVTINDRLDKNFRILSVKIVLESSEQVSLGFKFIFNAGYWYLNTVNLLDMSLKTYSLKSAGKEDIYAAKSFSYHCGGNSVFRDEDNEIELVLFDIQAQPDAREVRFDDAYDCVDFTTVPIWSGIFVVSMLLVGLAIGLGALNSIKTMDKFDNNKTKQLSITTAE